jgi:hypothetical protein
MPAQIEKSEDGEWKIAGLASTQGMDQQGETIIQKGIDLSPIDEQKGYFNFDHQKGPENLIGAIDGYSHGKQGLYVHGRLFKNHQKAKSVYEIMSSLSKGDHGRVGMSVEGQILERDASNPKIIKKCRINKVAITFNPVNTDTYANLIKSMSPNAEVEFNSIKENYNESSLEESTFTASQVLSIVEKALAMTQDRGSTAPNELTNGNVMTTLDMKSKKKKKKQEPSDDSQKMEDKVSVEKADKDPCWEGYKRKPGTKKYDKGSCIKKSLKPMSKELYKSNMLKMLDTLQKLHPDCSRVDIWTAIQERMETAFPDIYDSNDE